MRIEILLDSDELLEGAGQLTFDNVRLIELSTPQGRFQLAEVNGQLEVMGMDGLVINPMASNVMLLSSRERR